MATVTGVTAALLNEVKNNTIISARIDQTTGILYFKKGDGTTEFNVGRIVPKPFENYLVGDLYTTTVNRTASQTADALGGGTWARYAQGRVLVGYSDTSGSRFNAHLSEGGSEKVALSVNEMPSHNHPQAADGVNRTDRTDWQSHDHSHTGWTSGDGQHQHTYDRVNARGNISGGGGLTVGHYETTSTWSGAAGLHSHVVQTNGASNSHYHVIASQGGGAAHENMPPYITVYIWRRTG